MGESRFDDQDGLGAAVAAEYIVDATAELSTAPRLQKSFGAIKMFHNAVSVADIYAETHGDDRYTDEQGELIMLAAVAYLYRGAVPLMDIPATYEQAYDYVNSLPAYLDEFGMTKEEFLAYLEETYPDAFQRDTPSSILVPDYIDTPQGINGDELKLPIRPKSVEGPVNSGKTPFEESPDIHSPLVLDLDGDGVELTEFDPETTETFFDIDNDNFIEQTAWVHSDDGLLARDLDNSGSIESSAELFGSADVDGFAQLAELDDNGDHVVNQYDSAWSELVVWRDANGDAVTQDGELHSLASLNIISFDLAGVAQSNGSIAGNPVSHVSTYTLAGGTERSIVDAWFVHDNVRTMYVGEFEIDSRTVTLPLLRGYGELPDLFISMSLDEDLLDLVNEFLGDWEIARFENGASLDDDVQEILLTWAGVGEVDPSSRGGHIDARKLGFLEKLYGEEFRQYGSNPNPYVNAAAKLEESWKLVFHGMKAQLMAQVGAQYIFESPFSFDFIAGIFTGEMELSQSAIDDLESAAPSPGGTLHEYWQQVAQFLALTKGIENLTFGEEEMLDDAIIATDPLMSWEAVAVATAAYLDLNAGSSDNDVVNGTSSADTLYGFAGDDELTGLAGNDTLDGGSGSDLLDGGGDNDTLKPGTGGNTVYGRAGNDTYVYEGGDDVYSEYGGSGTDTILLPVGFTSGDLYFFRSKPEVGDVYDDMLVRVTGGGYITLSSILSSGRNFNSGAAIETFTFSDNTTLSISGFTSLDTFGSSGDDYIYGVKTSVEIDDNIYAGAGNDEVRGYGGADLLDGGDGNDELQGGDGNDIYVMSPGFDVIIESGGADILRLPSGYGSGDVSLIRQSQNANQLVVTVTGLGQVAVVNQFLGGGGSGVVETLDFNGTGAITLTSMSIETIGTSGNDTITGITVGASTNDIIDGGAGNDTMNGNAGNDVYWFSAGTDIVNENGGTDFVKFRHGVLSSEVTIYRGGTLFRSLIIEDNEGNKTTVTNHFNASATEVEKLIFANGTEWVLSTMEIEARGTAGNDTIASYASGDASTADAIFGYGGADGISGGYGNDILYGGDGNDTVNGQQDNDTLYGENGDDDINGSTGNDWLYGGTGDDDLDGGGGDDTFFWIPNEGSDTATESSGAADVLTIGSGYTINDISIVNESSYHAKLTVVGQTGQLILQNLRSSPGLQVEQISFDDGFITSLPDYNSWIKGTSGNDTVSGNNSDNTLIGYAGNDTMTGGSGDDDIHAGAGNDTLDGDDGTDLLYGGAGDDILYGEGGLDTLHGGVGADTYKFHTASAFSNVDVIRDFSVGDDDVIDLTDILGTAYDPLTDDLAEFISFSESSGSTFVSVDRDGTAGVYSMAQIIKLENVTGLASAETLETNGNLLAA